LSTPHFFNTVCLTGEELLRAGQQGRSQEDAIVFLLTHSPKRETTASQLLAGLLKYNLIAPGTPITSVRRAMSNLCKARKLTKLPRTLAGPLGKPEFLFSLINHPNQ